MVEKRVQIVNILGLHARAAARFVRAAARFRSEVTVTKDGTTTDGKSILGVLFLAAAAGSEITISTSGEDEGDALEALVKLVAEGLGE
ncbi:MAG TPA: HPr family phosphocarrier protein [Vicinamibacteria bacterium]|nr:HPr family phosphocarrier protein [Vicinamibacteria bacterium]